MVDLCGRCTHGMDGHLGKPCDNTRPDGSACPCPFGVRADVYACMQLSEIGMTLLKMFVLQQAVSGVEVVIENGRINVRQNQQQGSSIVIPGH